MSTKARWIVGTTLALAAGGLGAAGCSGGSSGGGGGSSVPSRYAFESRFDPGVSSVSYSGQTFRHLLIDDIVERLETLTDDIDNGALSPSVGSVNSSLVFFYEFDLGAHPNQAPTTSTTPPPLQSTYGQLSSTNKNLRGKTAGNDASTDHEDWTQPGRFLGWSDASIAANGGSIDTPEGLIRAFFWTVDQLAVDRDNGVIPSEPDGVTPVSQVTLTASGLDLRQLIQKFLLMAVAFSQGTDDYLDDDVADKGLLSSNAGRDDGTKPFTTLEHDWDEGFGYFGAARDYAEYTDDEVARAGGRADYQGHHDSNEDGRIDYGAEFNFGASTNAAKRDRGSSPQAPTDFSNDAFQAFLRGRALITQAAGELSSEELDRLRTERDLAVRAWENAIAATVVHYINDVLQRMSDFGTASYSFNDHAKEWSELKGFSLGLQFNPRSPLSSASFVQFHDLIGDRPVLPNESAGTISAYRQALLSARNLLQNTYGFAPENVGDADGLGGW